MPRCSGYGSRVSQKIVERAAARIVLLDPEDRILLQQIRADEDHAHTIWITPGGALAPGETHRQAALRELREKGGQASVPLGPCLCARHHEFAFRGTRYRQTPRFFLPRTHPPPSTTTQLQPMTTPN